MLPRHLPPRLLHHPALIPIRKHSVYNSRPSAKYPFAYTDYTRIQSNQQSQHALTRPPIKVLTRPKTPNAHKLSLVFLCKKLRYVATIDIRALRITNCLFGASRIHMHPCQVAHQLISTHKLSRTVNLSCIPFFNRLLMPLDGGGRRMRATCTLGPPKGHEQYVGLCAFGGSVYE